jgi:RNAse (barnase) inhibitor barstar
MTGIDAATKTAECLMMVLKHIREQQQQTRKLVDDVFEVMQGMNEEKEEGEK